MQMLKGWGEMVAIWNVSECQVKGHVGHVRIEQDKSV